MVRFAADSEENADIVGTLTIGGGASGMINVENAYLDSWLAGLLECMTAVKSGATHHEVDLVEEPKPLVVDVIDGAISLRFGDQTSILGPVDEAIEELMAGVRKILTDFRVRNEVLAREIVSKLDALQIE
jgi:hypothetical protein